MEYLKIFDETINRNLNDYVRKPTLIRGVVHLLLVLYAVRLAPELPKQVLVLFENQYFKLFVFSLILWTAQFSPSTSILIAVAFMVTMNYSNNKTLWEFMEDVKVDKPAEAIEAVKILAEAATTPEAVPVEKIAAVANVAVSQVKTEEGAKAVQALVDQAIAPSAAPVENVIAVSTIAVNSIVQPVPVVPDVPVVPVVPVVPDVPDVPVVPAPVKDEGCYPIRRYDMANIQPSGEVDSMYMKV